MNQFKNIAKRHRSLFRKMKRNLLRPLFFPKAKAPFTILSNNCTGGAVYEDLNIHYTTPIVGLFLFPDCYLKLLSNLEYYIAIDKIEFVNVSKYFTTKPQYPVGIIDDIEIHFLHYSDKESAIKKWNTRKERIVWDNIYVIMTDNDDCSDEHIQQFLNLDFKQKRFFSHKKIDDDNVIWVKEYKNRQKVGDLYTNRCVLRKHFDIHKWVTQSNYPTFKRQLVAFYRAFVPYCHLKQIKRR